MSFVIGVAHKGQVIIKSDGRLVNKAEDRIVDEYYDKTRKISNKVIYLMRGNDIRTAMKLCVIEVASKSPSVNSNVYEQTLCL